MTLMSISWGTEEKEISRPQIEAVESPDCTSASHVPCCVARPGRNLTTMVVLTMPSPVFTRPSLLPCWTPPLGRAGPGSTLAAGWVNELWTMAVLETCVWFLTLLEVLLFVETLALVLATWFSLLFVLTSTLFEFVAIFFLVLMIVSVVFSEEALVLSLVSISLVFTSTLLDLVDAFP